MATPASQSAQTKSSQQLNDLDDPELLRIYLEERPPENERAFAELYERWTPRLLAFLGRRYGVDPEDAEDLVAETWARVHRHAHRYEPDRRFSTWLFTICSNLGKNRLRSDERDPQIDMATLGQHRNPREDRPLQFESEEDWSDPTTSTANRQLMREITETIDSLTPIHRVVMRLYHLEGLSYQEIGEETGLALGTVKSRMHRAREKFRDEWRRREEQADEGEKGPRVHIGPDGELEIVRPEPGERDELGPEDTPDSSGEEKADPEPEHDPEPEPAVQEDRPRAAGQRGLSEAQVKEIRARARRNLPAKGGGQWDWFRRVAPEYSVSSNVVHSVVAATGGYQDAGPNLTERAGAEAA